MTAHIYRVFLTANDIGLLLADQRANRAQFFKLNFKAMFINFIYVGLAFMAVWGLVELLESYDRLKETKQVNRQLIDQLKKVNKELAQLDKNN